MKPFIALATLLTIASATDISARHARIIKRQDTTASSATTSASSSSSSALSETTSGSSVTSESTTSGAATSAATSAASSVLTTAGTGIPPLSQITSGAVSESTIALSSTPAVGETPAISGAPPLPSFVFSPGDWPKGDVTPDTSSSEVQEWLKELDGYDIPDLDLTDGTCAGSPAASADAANRGWWTCGGYTRATDIEACPDQLTWGMSFDDGPGFHTTKLLDYLAEKDIKSTFFVVGSRVIERPDVVRSEYVSGHEISVHTWSHPPLTKLTNEQIVAELGWTRKAIQETIGVTPVTMRPPYGDIDDRVRAISLAMGMVPIIWTRSPSGSQFDTNDWKVPAGTVTGNQSVEAFQYILGNATELDSGFIVLQHDLYQQAVDIAVGYTLNLALSFQPALTLQPIGVCQGWPNTDLYLETTTNTTFPYPDSVAASQATTTASARATAIGESAQGSSGARSAHMPALGALFAGLSVLLGGFLFV